MILGSLAVTTFAIAAQTPPAAPPDNGSYMYAAYTVVYGVYAIYLLILRKRNNDLRKRASRLGMLRD
jgi:hypothetical protein